MTRDDLLAGIARWRETGYGIDPNQAALRHYDRGECECMTCRPGLLPIVETWPRSGGHVGMRVEHYPKSAAEVATLCGGAL